MSEEQRPFGEDASFVADPMLAADPAPVADTEEAASAFTATEVAPEASRTGDPLLTCEHCGGALPAPASGDEWSGACPACGTATLLNVFPRALDGAPVGHQGLARTADDQATCFEHTDRVAEASCEACGRFVCGTCRVDLYDKVYCAPCLERAAENGELPQLLNELERADLSALVFLGLPVSLGAVVGLIALLATLDFGVGIGAAFGIAFPTAIFCIPLGLAQLYSWRKRKITGPKAQSRATLYVVIAIAVLFVLFIVAVPMISMLTMFATANK